MMREGGREGEGGRERGRKGERGEREGEETSLKILSSFSYYL